MIRRGIVSQRLVAVFILGWLLLGFPLVSLFDRPDAIFGVPVLIIYLSTAWIVLIVLLAAIVERRR
ncbi:MAG TPA: hypothetical protein VGL25_05040 [Casimicrobiaceae bacterium]|jgi:hypothetical protein